MEEMKPFINASHFTFINTDGFNCTQIFDFSVKSVVVKGGKTYIRVQIGHWPDSPETYPAISSTSNHNWVRRAKLDCSDLTFIAVANTKSKQLT